MADEKAADKLMKQAEKCLRPSVLAMRLKPEWDEALALFEKAALQYKACFSVYYKFWSYTCGFADTGI